MQAVIVKTLRAAQLKPHYVDLLLSRQDLYEQAFTSKSYDPKINYEVFEHLGDASANSFVPWYFFRRFPQFNCTEGVQVLARLKINYSSKQTFSSIAEKLGFWPHIRASAAEKQSSRKALLEDVFEAFIGVTIYILDEEFAVGVGFNVVYDILKSIYDEMPISLKFEDLYDAKTRLKELFDKYGAQLGQLIYEDANRSLTIYRKTQNGQKIVLGTATGNKKDVREQLAAQQALNLLEKDNFTRKTSFALVCEM